MFLSVSRVLPDLYPLQGELDDYIADEHTVGRLLDLGVIVPRLTELYRWSADELRIPGRHRPRLRRHADLRVEPRRPETLDTATDTARPGRPPGPPATASLPGPASAGSERTARSLASIFRLDAAVLSRPICAG